MSRIGNGLGRLCRRRQRVRERATGRGPWPGQVWVEDLSGQRLAELEQLCAHKSAEVDQAERAYLEVADADPQRALDLMERWLQTTAELAETWRMMNEERVWLYMRSIHYARAELHDARSRR